MYVPENGFIGVNVPLTRACTGSLSTRTTHPHLMGLLAQATATIRVHNPIVNPLPAAHQGGGPDRLPQPGLLRQLVPIVRR